MSSYLTFHGAATGKWLKAERHASSAQRMYEASQTRRELDVCRCIIGLGQLYQGQLETAREMGMRVLEYRHEHPQLLYWSTYLVIACLNTMRRFKDSSDVFARIKNYPCPLLTLTLQVRESFLKLFFHFLRSDTFRGVLP